MMSLEDVQLIRTLARSRLDSRGFGNSKPGLWFQAMAQIEALCQEKLDKAESRNP